MDISPVRINECVGYCIPELHDTLDVITVDVAPIKIKPGPELVSNQPHLVRFVNLWIYTLVHNGPERYRRYAPFHTWRLAP